MPDPSVASDAQPAASSAAPVATPAESISLDSLSESQLSDWRMTGKLPTYPPTATPPADSSPAEPVAQVASTDAKPELASEAGTARPDPRATENRIPELLAERKRERERAERAERRAAELEARLQPKPDVRPAASSPAPAGLVKPDPEKFPYGTSDPNYLEALTDYKVAVHGAQQRAAWEEGQRVARARAESERVMSAFEEKRAKAKEKYPDFDAVAMLAPTEIPQGSAADLWVLEDESGAEILYHLQQPANAAERRRILALGPREQLKELVRLGDRLTGEAPVARSTTAPPPPPALRTRATPADPVERALADGDSDEATRAYINAANAREMQRLKR